MRPTYRVLASLAALSLAAGVATATFAQTPPAAAPNAAAHEHWAERAHHHAEARAKALHDILNIRPDQDAAFQTFLAAMKPPEHADGRRGWDQDREGMEHLTTPERLDKMAARLAEHQAEFQRHADAIKAFYAVLSPEQQRAFDALPPRFGHGGHGGHGHFGGPRGQR